MSPVEKIFVANDVESEHITVKDFIFHEQKRHEYKKLSNEELKNKTEN